MITAKDAKMHTEMSIEFDKKKALDNGMPKIMDKIRKAVANREFYVCVKLSAGELLALISLGYEATCRDYDGYHLVKW